MSDRTFGVVLLGLLGLLLAWAGLGLATYSNLVPFTSREWLLCFLAPPMALGGVGLAYAAIHTLQGSA